MTDTPPTEEPEPVFVCDEDGCGFVFPDAQRLGVHRFHTHHIIGERHRGKPRRAPQRRRPPKKLPEPALTALEANDVVTVVLEQMFPHGIPVETLPAVLRWRDATLEFMKEVS